MHPSNEFFSVIPEAIKQASGSPLGILALLAIILGLLGWFFFQRGPIWAKFTVWILLFAGAVMFFAVSVATAASIGAKGFLTVSGTVVDSTSNDALKLAQVSIVGTPENAVSDDNGYFSLEIARAGNAQIDLRLRVSKEGYQPYDSTITAPCPPMVVLLHRSH